MKRIDMNYFDIPTSIESIEFYGIASAMGFNTNATADDLKSVDAAKKELIEALIEFTKKNAAGILIKHMNIDYGNIDAEVHTDDRAVSHKFNAAPYFADITDKQIMDILRRGYSGCESTDQIALEYPLPEKGIEEVMHYLNHIRQTLDMGFECSVDEDDVLAWVRVHRPALIEKITAWYRENEIADWEYPA